MKNLRDTSTRSGFAALLLMAFAYTVAPDPARAGEEGREETSSAGADESAANSWSVFHPAGTEPVFAPGGGAEGGSGASLDAGLMQKHFWRAAGEVFAVNLLVWSYNRWIRPGGGEGFRIGFRSWGENIKNGFEWDDNNFNTNQFAHPYHGSLYFNAARSNGYTFWESIPFAFGGSFMWEYFGETHHPSMNDWIATSIGGVELGEVLHRFAIMITDNEKSGSKRTWQELGGFLVNPVRGFNRLVTGEAFKTFPNPKDRYPKGYRANLDAGLRTIGQDRIWEGDTTSLYLNFEFDYGDPYRIDLTRPFDHFKIDFQINFDDVSTIGRIQSRGLLYGGVVRRREKSTQILAGYLDYDFIHNRAFQYGAQGVGVSFLTQYFTGGPFELHTDIHLNGVILGAVQSDYRSFSGREYDYGPGLGFRFSSILGNQKSDVFTFALEQFYVHAINGNEVDHYVTMGRAKFAYPFANFLGVGLEYILQLRESRYVDFPDVSKRNPQVRIFATWDLN